MEPTRLVLDSGELPNDHEDAGLIRQYEERGGDIRRLIYLSLGETWNAVAPGLAAILASGLPVHSHGYTLSPYGLPALRDVLRDYVRRTHRLPQAGTETYDVAVSQSGTRAAMSDFGRLLLTDARTPDTAPAALVPSPGWDYGGVLAPLGYRLLPYDPGAVRGWQPDPAEIESLLDRAGHWSLVVLNPQHNPTGANWAPETVRAIVEAAVARRAAILLDDAYYALYTPGQLPSTRCASWWRKHRDPLSPGSPPGRWASSSTATAGASEPSPPGRPPWPAWPGPCMHGRTVAHCPCRQPWPPGCGRSRRTTSSSA